MQKVSLSVLKGWSERSQGYSISFLEPSISSQRSSNRAQDSSDHAQDSSDCAQGFFNPPESFDESSDEFSGWSGSSEVPVGWAYTGCQK